MKKRLEQVPTLRIDQRETLTLTFEGKDYQGVAGDTIATALFAGGVRLFGRSLKYHRPRGLYSLDGECSNTCLEVDGVPNVRAENTLLKDGMEVKPQNVSGSLENDRLALIDKIDGFMPAGFYYKTMHKPAAIWPIAMKQIRKIAGMGVIAPDYEMKGNPLNTPIQFHVGRTTPKTRNPCQSSLNQPAAGWLTGEWRPHRAVIL